MTATMDSFEPQNTDGFVLFPLTGTARLPAPGWTSLDGRGLLSVSGSDAETFLQGQLTQDMARVLADRALLAAHCTPKGRISTLFTAWPDGQGGFLLDCPAELQPGALRRLRLYVLRAKVQIAEASTGWSRVGLFGSAVPERLAALGWNWPDAPGTLGSAGEHRLLRLPGDRWILLGPATARGSVQTAIAALLPQDDAGWALSSLRAGAPEVLLPTTERFVPQMLNLDTLDGVSFRKGCYTGQEIVARTHYLGKVKRRMVWLGYAGAGVPAPGSRLTLLATDSASAVAPVTATDAESADSAEVVLALATHAMGGEALAVVRVADDDTP